MNELHAYTDRYETSNMKLLLCAYLAPFLITAHICLNIFLKRKKMQVSLKDNKLTSLKVEPSITLFYNGQDENIEGCMHTKALNQCPCCRPIY